MKSELKCCNLWPPCVPDSSFRVLIIHESSWPFSYFLPMPLFFKCISVPEIFFVSEKFIPWHFYLDIRAHRVCQKQHLAKAEDFGIQKCSPLFPRSWNHPDQAPLLIGSFPCFSEIGPVTITTDPKKFQYELRELYVQVGSDSSSWREVTRP